MYIAREVVTGVTSQGRTIEEAPEALEKLSMLKENIVGVMEVRTSKSTKSLDGGPAGI